MRGKTLATVLAACVLLTACGPVPEENAGGVATPSVLDSGSAAPPDTPTVLPSDTPTETAPAVRPSAPARHAAPKKKPVRRAAPRRTVPHRPVHRAPKAPAHPAGATAECRDGTYSYAAHHQGACSHHGGVLVFFH
ncbi:DUF3761 domain-containing protein [Actinomadura sp. DC4]|uniref:DUF3761 domain-containing protein n=1 Tax=Actinomadura sp. DC4 TaxID=3055069 RepID=UPI0025B11302|nr:DUF3761 domain-containing protein [Actinomadura sp. DC4]MDN3359845.1 DUF3761 domain-containing protein [Actinomadura sp. DC4]